jgi:hypothetical protein
MLESAQVLHDKRPLLATPGLTAQQSPLTPPEVKALERASGAKARAVVSALREVGMIGAAKQAEIEAAQANLADVQARTNSAKQHHDQILESIMSMRKQFAA